MDQSEETAETTTETGIRFLDSIRNARDKTGRPIATNFLTLPDRHIPGYYEVTKLPIALDTIETKLLNREYHNLSALESDCKRMVANAKSFNEKGSALYEDAERVRKTASNFMTRHNPAYRNPNYVAVATPIPDDTHMLDVSMQGTPSYSGRLTMGGAERSARRGSSAISARKSVSIQDDDEDIDPSDPQRFKGRTLEKAQDMIISELIDHEEEGLQIFTPFINLPSRTLTDYYQVIRHPVSLKSLQKRVRGIHGRNAATGISDFHSWDAFEEEVTYVWENAQTYNEDGSEMFNLANEFEETFREKLEAAKALVHKPQAQTLKLKVAEPKQSGIKIKFGAMRDSPSSTPGPSTPARSTPGLLVHNDALERQQQMVSAGVNGARSTVNGGPRNPFTGSGGAIPPLPTSASRSASAASIPVLGNGVKNETATQSPSLNPIHPAHAAVQYGGPLRPTSNSPHPQQQTSSYYTTQASDGPPPGLVPSKFRAKDQDPSDYLLPSVLIQTHPALGLRNPLSFRVPASKTSLHQSVTFTVPASQYQLQITPNIPVAATDRGYRIFVMVNGHRHSENTKLGNQERDKTNPIFECSLGRGGVSKIEVEILAVKVNPKTNKEEVQWEKSTAFVHVLRN
ncbi:Bromodomain-containing protein [Microthyrium microscopicum]|uniref:Bromodomain-containing protein n=1 Tax=Microthyrium microscopicum TaxID=703497 RepID=A0A6A6UQS1_9PEZI|nr:Bromodomain-containing protein [Microthyrium microscopicum]